MPIRGKWTTATSSAAGSQDDARVPPASLPVKLNFEYFSLSQSGPPWEAITRARNLAAYVPGEFPEPEMELLVLLPQAMK